VLSEASPGTLHFRTYTGVLSKDNVAAELRRGVAWEVAYSASYGADAPTLTGPRDEGRLHIVNQPFSTGLTHHLLVSHVATLGASVPSEQQDWTPQIRLAEADLIEVVRNELLPLGYVEDDIIGPQRLRGPHIDLTTARILRLTDPETAKELRAEALANLRLALRQVELDTDGDGEPDEAETQVTGSRTSFVGGSFPNAAKVRSSFRHRIRMYG